jgi:hypothetical protein
MHRDDNKEEDKIKENLDSIEPILISISIEKKLTNIKLKTNESKKQIIKTIKEKKLIYELDKTLNFHTFKGTKTKITCHGRPSKGILKNFKENYGINYILTLQHEKENIDQIKNEASENGIQWYNIPLQGGSPGYLMNKNTTKLIVNSLDEIYKNILSNELTIYIHCAAGIHRTGVILYCLLRMNGENIENSINIIKNIRMITGDKVGDFRIKGAETYIVPELLKLNNKEILSISSVKD